MQAYRRNVRENMLLALDTLRTHKFRSFLTVLGVLIGTTTVIAVTSIIAGLDKQLVDVAEQFGTRTLWVYKMEVGAPHRLTRDERLRKPLTYEDAMAIKEQCPSAQTVALELFREMGEFGLPPVTARYKGQDMVDALFVGVTADLLQMINATVGEGRFFTEGEDLHHRDVAVIGNGVYKRFFEHADAIGKTIVVDGHSLEVIGTLT
jgi:putative ABC transport system permease protein